MTFPCHSASHCSIDATRHVALRDRLRTFLCDLLGISHPIMQAAIWPATSPELVAAVSNAAGLGSLAAIFSTAEELANQVARTRELTHRPFAVNHVVPMLDEAAFARTLALRPAVISLALGDPGDLVSRAHDAGITVIHQVHTVDQARQAAVRGVDAIVAQGVEAGGQGLDHGPTTMVLVPQVVDAVAPIPVLAAGGIADGRGLAAALALGVQGVNVGTRFFASPESSAPPAWKELVLASESNQVVRFDAWAQMWEPPGPTAYPVVPNVIRTGFVDAWLGKQEQALTNAGRLREEIMSAMRGGRLHELTPFAGQTAGMIRESRPAAVIIEDMVGEAERLLGC